MGASDSRVCDHSSVPNSQPGPCGYSGEDLLGICSAVLQGDVKDQGPGGGMMQPFSGEGFSGSMRGKADGSWRVNFDKDTGLGKHAGKNAESCCLQ
eukprot:CAMPEP_0206549214 /NCGR_PEP_ID=MMETSP0325_2-20121206/14334_1 /ASSEMBLY_ACC=CAM_ASM_000347 /TAXON_ID=2866 /ORGANISM="Crypthecodinium cohnii, Strain Seligo" /LENGTH=95 /DNA_ID=CAMNT_0054048819 /DNA_START=8 /DNA_END=295 /DNA_ORIENTATION=+